ncbi:Ribonuclease H-like domain containing protein [Trema orientale]|uniref:Ribonuclease H-like domain containing protein n=1 Tax=Trema orientale TaxID=63057 RepID=A0A2P5AHQ4_TREOI|nr:Ribonuclease H-like domain containing protein [Trema orientale]
MVAIVARDNLNNILRLAAKKVQASSALQAEILAVEFGSQLCLAQGWNNAILFSDAQLVAIAVALRRTPQWDFTFLCLPLFSLLNSCNISVCWIPRVTNKSTHALVSWALRSGHVGFFSTWEIDPYVATILFLID